jgi:hypothetical protein
MAVVPMNTDDISSSAINNNSRHPQELYVQLLFQIRLLLWKRYVESTKTKWDIARVFAPALLIFILIILVYTLNLFNPGGLEPFLAPLAFFIFIQRLVVQIMFEKSNKLQESMRMMGLHDSAYWLSYFISDGLITGCVLSFLCAIISAGGLFNGANFGTVWGMIFVYCLSVIPFGFFICSFFDTPQTCGQATLGLLLG